MRCFVERKLFLFFNCIYFLLKKLLYIEFHLRGTLLLKIPQSSANEKCLGVEFSPIEIWHFRKIYFFSLKINSHIIFLIGKTHLFLSNFIILKALEVYLTPQIVKRVTITKIVLNVFSSFQNKTYQHDSALDKTYLVCHLMAITVIKIAFSKPCIRIFVIFWLQ